MTTQAPGAGKEANKEGPEAAPGKTGLNKTTAKGEDAGGRKDIMLEPVTESIPFTCQEEFSRCTGYVSLCRLNVNLTVI